MQFRDGISHVLEIGILVVLFDPLKIFQNMNVSLIVIDRFSHTLYISYEKP